MRDKSYRPWIIGWLSFAVGCAVPLIYVLFFK
jgi:hypothetical protein